MSVCCICVAHGVLRSELPELRARLERAAARGEPGAAEEEVDEDEDASAVLGSEGQQARPKSEVAASLTPVRCALRSAPAL